MIIDEWKGCYPSSWRGIITPESFQHPAKASSKLAERIYKHAIAEGWLHEGSRCVDPFGGIGGFAFHAMLNGMDMTLVELEPKFVTLAQANIDAWNAKYAGRLARWGTARILQGDSRHLAQVIGVAEACISSPPFSGVTPHNGGDAEFIDDKRLFGDYGSTPGNLGNLPPGNVDAVISSPPYADNRFDGGEESLKQRQGHSAGYGKDGGYGQTPGQLAALPPGAPPFEGCVSSPPFEASLDSKDEQFIRKAAADALSGNTKGHGSSQEYLDRVATWNGYGNTGGNIGNDSGDTFWSAAREIVAQVYQVLAPGAHAVWVVKSYVKNKQLVDFPHQWQTLCESVGFVTLHEHHALLVRHGATSIDIDGNHHEHKTESKSFFRRLAEKNGSPHIDFETVLCMVKPGGEGGGWDGAISSPPYIDSDISRTQSQGTSRIDPTSPNYRPSAVEKHTRLESPVDYGTTPGQLGSLPPGSPPDTRHGEGG